MAKTKTAKRKTVKRNTHHEPNILAGAIAGLAAGLVASFVMEQAQALAGRLGLDPSADSDADPSTVKAAQAVAVRARGFEIEDEQAKKTAGSAVHYVTGTLLGVAYGIAAEYREESTAGFGSAFGVGTSLFLDEAAVPALGLSGPPTETPAAGHAFGIASHLVYGVTAEMTRRAVRSAFD